MLVCSFCSQQDWTEVALPDRKETIDGLLTSLEIRLQGDEACQLVAQVRKLLEKREEVVRRCKHEEKELELQMKVKSEDFQKQLFHAHQDLRKCHEKMEHLKKQHMLEEEQSPASSSLVHQLHRELADTKAMRKKDKERIEMLNRKVIKYKAKTEEFERRGIAKEPSSTARTEECEQRSAKDLLKAAKTHVPHALLDAMFTDVSLDPATVEEMLKQNELAQKHLKKQIKELKKEVESKDEHIERMSQRILDIKKEKEVS